MTYKQDPILPILQGEIEARTSAFQALSPAEESDLLQLNAEQKRAISDSDKREKQAYLMAQPNINHAGVKMHEKYRNYVAGLGQ